MLCFLVTLADYSVHTAPRPAGLHFPALITVLSLRFFSEQSSNDFKASASSPTSFVHSRASSIQALPHSFVFRIFSNPRYSNNFRTLAPKTGGYTPAWSDHDSSLAAVSCQLPAPSSPLTPFTATLTQRQGGTGYWSYQRSSLLAVSCRLLAFHSFLPPCPSTHFPLQWEPPFPVLTGEEP